MLTLLIATHNEGKKREFTELFSGLGLHLVSLKDLQISAVVPEVGVTYLENAMIKARRYAELSGLLTLADDSGLEVDALNGEPGVYSARFGGVNSDAERYEKLLELLEGVPENERTARFRCVIALCQPDGSEQWVEGLCDGRITTAPRGDNGFGYDPVFWVQEAGMTMAELPGDVKNQISHRAKAASKMRELLEPIVAQHCRTQT